MPLVGIDLGTTFSCVACVGDGGVPTVIRDGQGNTEVPSVISFDGRDAYVGCAAVERKGVLPHTIFELFKRDIGKPLDSAHGGAAPYEVGGFKFGAAGMSAILLRYLKKQAIRHFRKTGELDETDDRKVALDAVITVPASFGDKERNETKLAGEAAGFRVVGMINEPTAAALAFGLGRKEELRILVFDLGGGTFDATLLRMASGVATVEATRGDNSLGGKDFDDLIERYLAAAAFRATGVHVPEERGFELQRHARRAKHELSECEQVEVAMTHGGEDLVLTLHRKSTHSSLRVRPSGENHEFYFEERSTDLLHRCRAICETLFDEVSIETKAGTRRVRWSDIDEIVLAGGSCRMPMIAEMIERVSGKRVQRHIEGFSYDTAIAVGAALYGVHREDVSDVLSHGMGVKVLEDGRPRVDCLVERDTRVPVTAERSYRAPAGAVLEVYEGESRAPDECELRGRLELNNPEGQVRIEMAWSSDGILRVLADFPPHGRRELEIKNEDFQFGRRLALLRERVASLTVHA
ncbi:MAG: Hsp70 family protein [Holophagales bacterium]|nr:MAG: Hsp70 family protein [Holophagales bacterium]